MDTPCFTRTKEIDSKSPATHYSRLIKGLSRGQASLVFQMQTGHMPLNTYLHTIGKRESARCAAFRTAQETVHHSLIVCPVQEKDRWPMIQALHWGTKSLGVLLNNKGALSCLFRFIAATGNFWGSGRYRTWTTVSVLGTAVRGQPLEYTTVGRHSCCMANYFLGQICSRYRKCVRSHLLPTSLPFQNLFSFISSLIIPSTVSVLTSPHTNTPCTHSHTALG